MLIEIQKIFQEKKDFIEEWLTHYSEPLNDPIYCSLDLRNAGFKISPVDANIFPGGWNNLCQKYSPKIAQIFKEFIQKNYPETKKILIIPENHTRNVYYLSNLKRLEKIMTDAGFEIKIGTLNEELGEENQLKTAEEETIMEYRIHREGNRLKIKDFDADLYILNNDLSVGMPEILKNLEIPLNPSPLGGWYNRRKSDHFHCYQILANMFSGELNIDPWTISAYFDQAESIDFSKKSGLEIVAEKVDTILQRTEKKYKEYKIDAKPYVFIKNEAGTYGMAVTSVDSAKQVLEMNNDTRTKMNIGKGNIKVSNVIMQEGVPTSEKIGEKTGEPVFYLINSQVVGGFYRAHEKRDEKQSLNTPGMSFIAICMESIDGYSNSYKPEITLESMMYVYRVISRLTSIATGYEIIGLKEG